MAVAWGDQRSGCHAMLSSYTVFSMHLYYNADGIPLQSAFFLSSHDNACDAPLLKHDSFGVGISIKGNGIIFYIFSLLLEIVLILLARFL